MGGAPGGAGGGAAGVARGCGAVLRAGGLVAQAGRDRTARGAVPGPLTERLPASGGNQRAPAGDARPGAEYLRRLGGAAGPRLHRVLRLRRLWICSAVVAAAAQPRRDSPAGMAVDTDGADRRGHLGSAGGVALAAADRRLPGDRHVVLR